MIEDCLKLTTYFGERDRLGSRFLADAFVEIYARHRLQTSLVMRGVEGFGAKHHLHTDRLLTLSEDLPLVAVAVDTPHTHRGGPPRATGPPLRRARHARARSHADRRARSRRTPRALHEATKLTVYVGRHERIGGQPAHRALVELLHQKGIAGATVLLGVDGTAHGERRRARFVGGNPDVPLMVISIGDGRRIASLLPELGAMLPRPLVTLERVRVCKRDGVKLAEPHDVAETDASGLGVWQKLMVYAGEQSSHRGAPLNGELVRALRRADAAGATSLRGIWGYHGDHEPHGDTFLQLRRRVPVLTVIVDTPDRIRDWFAIADELTDETGLVTSEMVPAYRATGPELQRGGLRLADPTP